MTGKPEVETDGLGEATMILSGETEAGSEGAREERGRYHAVEEEGVPLREIAQAIGRGLEMPVVSLSPHKVAEHVGATAIGDRISTGLSRSYALASKILLHKRVSGAAWLAVSEQEGRLRMREARIRN